MNPNKCKKLVSNRPYKSKLIGYTAFFSNALYKCFLCNIFERNCMNPTNWKNAFSKISKKVIFLKKDNLTSIGFYAISFYIVLNLYY